MSKFTSKKIRSALIILVAVGLVIDFCLLLAFLLKDTNVALFNPKGWVAEQQFNLFVLVTGSLVAFAAVSVIILYFTAWRYRASNNKSTYQPKAHTSKAFVVSLWLIPSLFAVFIIAQMIPATYKLHPKQAIDHEKDPMVIQVVSMNWKWLFIYPRQNIASVNFVQIPVDTPIRFEMTADQSPMSSFWIPNLGGQLYTMTTHVNRLNLIADTIGDYPGKSAEINGDGFAGMKFTARVSSQTDFDSWVSDVQQSPEALDMNVYNKLLEPSENHPVTLYSLNQENLFAKVVQKYYEPVLSQPEGQE